MKIRFHYLKMLVFIGCCGFLMSGCEKLTDYLKHHDETDFKACNIKKITVATQNTKYLDTLLYTFTYNYLGNPVSVINNRVGTGNPNFTFKYDKYNRLKELIRPYTNGSYENDDRYGYNAKGQIVADTNYAFWLMSGTEALPSPLVAYVSFVYDDKGRIIHEAVTTTRYSMPDLAYSVDHAYDGRGNLINGAVYNNELNIYRTNNIWMFLSRDYSVNSTIANGQFNEHGLPLHYNGAGIGLFPAAAGDITINYFCH